MAGIKQRTLGRDLSVTSGDVITGQDDASGDLPLEGGAAAAASNTTGGKAILRGGAGDGTGDGGGVEIYPGTKGATGSPGIVKVTNNNEADTVPILQLASESGGNAEDIRVFVGTQSPNTNVTGNPGDLYVTHNGASSTLSVNTGAADSNTTWTDLATGGGGGTLEEAVEDTGATNANQDQSFDWRIADAYDLTFSNNDGSNILLDIDPGGAGGSDAITIGGTESGDTVIVRGPSTGATPPKATHTGADTIPVFMFETTGTNGEDIRVFVGTQDPDGTISGNPGDLYVTHNGANSTLSVNIGASDANTTWADLQAGVLTGLSTLAQVDVNQSTGSIAATGGTASLDITSFINEGVIYELSLTRTAGTGGDDIDVEIFSKDTKLTGDRLYFAEAADASTAYIDSSGIFYEDEDTSAELHIKVTNNSAAAATFTVRARAQGESPVGQVKQLDSWTMDEAALPASNPAGSGTRNDHRILAFDQTTSENAIFEGVMSEDYDNTSDLKLDLIWTGASAGSGTDVVEWEVAWRRMNDNTYALTDATYHTTYDTGSVTVPTTDGQVKRTTITFTNTEANGVQTGEAYRYRVTRDTGIANNFAGDAQLIRIQLHT